MKRRTPSQWRALFSEHKMSGLTATAFCREHGLNPKYFSLRRKQLQDGEDVKPDTSFVPVVMSPTCKTSVLELKRGHDFVLTIPPSVSPTWLATLLQQLQV